jgi:hypothetical protein
MDIKKFNTNIYKNSAQNIIFVIVTRVQKYKTTNNFEWINMDAQILMIYI